MVGWPAPDCVQSLDAQLAKVVPLVDALQCLRVDVVKHRPHDAAPLFPRQARGQQPLLARDAEIALVFEQPDPREKEALSRCMQLCVCAPELCPEVVAEHLREQRFDEDAGPDPGQVQVDLFSDDHLAPQHYLAMQWPGSRRTSCEPEVAMNLVQAWHLHQLGGVHGQDGIFAS